MVSFDNLDFLKYKRRSLYAELEKKIAKDFDGNRVIRKTFEVAPDVVTPIFLFECKFRKKVSVPEMFGQLDSYNVKNKYRIPVGVFKSVKTNRIGMFIRLSDLGISGDVARSIIVELEYKAFYRLYKEGLWKQK